jgi:hypothetical protein
VTYYYVVSATNTCGESYYNSMEDAASGGLPSPWNDVDVGSVGVAGTGNYNNGVFTVQGEGYDIGSSSDSFNYAYLTMTNNGAFIARLTSTGTGGKVGLMFRESTNVNSKMAAVLFDVGGGIARFPTRSSTGGNMSWIDGPAMSAAQWFKLQRSGSTFTGYTSGDGVTWVGVGTNTFTMNSVLLAGLAVCSRNTGTLNVSTFDTVSLPGWTPPPSPPAKPSASATNAQVNLKWNAATNATGYRVKRALVSGGAYTPLAATSSTNFADNGVANGATYYYVITATNRAGESADSSEVSARPESSVAPPLTFLNGGGQVQLSWPLDHLGWELQMQTNSTGVGLNTNWAAVPGSTVTNRMWLAVNPAAGSTFFRLVLNP